jgi:VWFA-related protein
VARGRSPLFHSYYLCVLPLDAESELLAVPHAAASEPQAQTSAWLSAAHALRPVRVMARLPAEMMRLFVVGIALALAIVAQEPVFRSGVTLVRVDTEALDAAGQILIGLKKEDFQVFDEGSQQPVVSFSFEAEPLDLILLFDLSGSMRSKLLRVVRAVELGFHELKPGDRVCVMAFNSGGLEVAPFTDDLDAVNQTVMLKVLGLHFGGSSNAGRGVADATLRFRREPKSQRRRAVLVITDKPESMASGTQAAVRDLWEADAVLSDLVIGNAPDTQVLERGGNVAAGKTGGLTVVAGDPGPSFQTALRMLRRRYTLYYAAPGGAPGSERRIEVRSPVAGARIRARTGYVVNR